MTNAALIIGIDEYANQPLTSAVNDAQAFKQALLDLGLVDPVNITMLTAPRGGDTAPTSKGSIADTLFEFYDRGDAYERFFFFFAGHGLLVFSDAARSRARTVLLPSDVVSLKQHGRNLLDLHELQERLRFNGPGEQYFFIDACRDLNYQEYPDVGGLGWGGGRPLGPARRQATLYAVSELGKAEAAVGGLGRMTTHLLDALRSDIAAVVYDDPSGEWAVTMRSLSDYVKWAVEKELAGQPLWKLQYMTPRLDEPDPKTSPLRVVHAVGSAPLTVHIAPEQAADQTQVEISLRGQRLDNYCLPPRRNHETLALSPQHYRIDASSVLGATDPERHVIDVRKEHEINIQVGQRPTAPVPDSGPSQPTVHVSPAFYEPPVLRGERKGIGPGLGSVRAEANEPQVTIELEGLEPPYQRWSGLRTLQQRVPAGPYRVRFRLGVDVFSEQELYVEDGEELDVRPTLAVSPLIQETLDFLGEPPPTAVISESIGPMQAGLLETMLPIIGIKPFDITDQLFGQFSGLIAPRDPALFGMRPLSLVVAVDGNRWSAHPVEVLRSVRCTLYTHDGAENGGLSVAFEPLTRSSLHGSRAAGTGSGLDRVGLAVVSPPPGSFSLRWESPYFGQFRLASASLLNRATVVTLILRPDGALEISQNLLRLPGRDELYVDELVPNISYGRMVRELQLGQQLYRSGELIAVNQQLSDAGDQTASMLIYAKWTDPILGCMAYFARLLRAEEGEYADNWAMQEAAHNLNRFFSELADARVVFGLANSDQQEATFAELVRHNQIPLLAEGTRRLAAYAEAHGLADSPVAQIARRIPVDQIWTVTSAR